MMSKKLISFIATVLLILGATTQLKAQEAQDEPKWESIMLVPDNTKLKVLGENMRKHNQKYHKEGAFKASVYNILSGPNSGKLIWMMGPLKFSDLDTRPAEGGHDEDWRDNIMPYVMQTEQGEYWEGDSKLSNTSMLPNDPSTYPILFTRYWEVNPGHGFSVESHLEMASKTIKAMPGVHPWGVYNNLFVQGKIGRHIATVSFHKNWTDFGTSWPFRTTFDEVHGANTWDSFIRNRDVTYSNWWDEIWVYDKALSGD
ncbi:hypothetical protein [uncultured Muriicola sp.]|uniref:hypothetical protein n=1 Tax=uncultured Muriicola sp. TaxID=1583102 RepID=UPI0026301517|nr:hypothetical protein [uncultured Muriicola sp.]